MNNLEIERQINENQEKYFLTNETSTEKFFWEIYGAIKSTLGPYGMEKFLLKNSGENVITNDGATILNNMVFTHPISKIIVEVAKSQDFEIGDGTTTVCLLCLDLLAQMKSLIKEGVHPKKISNVLKKAASISTQYIEEVGKVPKCNTIHSLKRMMISCCATSLNSKLISAKRHIFSEMIVDIGLFLGSEFDSNMVSIKEIIGGNLMDSFFLKGIIIKKPFSYAGYEKQNKKVYYPYILLLDIELEIKTEKNHSETKIKNIKDYKTMIDAEWSIMYEKLDKITMSGVKTVFSKKSIGDLATQYFAERDIICGGRISNDDLFKISRGTGASIVSNCSDLNPNYLGKCKIIEEKQIGKERFIIFAGCPVESATIVIKGGNRKLLDETKRCLNDGIMILKRVTQNRKIVGGAGSIEMKISSKIKKYANYRNGLERKILFKFATSLEIIPKTLCENAGLDLLSIISFLRSKHYNENSWLGIDMEKGFCFDAIENFIWEPVNVKINAIQAAVEVVSVLLTIGLAF